MRKFSLLVLVMMGVSVARAADLDVAMPIEINVFGWVLSFSNNTVFMCLFAALAIFFFLYWCTRNLSLEKPSKKQVVAEMIVSAFDGLCKQSLGPNRGRVFLPYIGTLFLFIWMSNMSGLFEFIPLQMIPHGVEKYEDYNGNGQWDPGEPTASGNLTQTPGFPMPSFEEPTKNLAVPLGMALLFVFLMGHGSGIRYNGLKGYLAEYVSPGGFIGVAMLPLNIVGKIAEVVSISFRLFGNIFGGAVIIIVVSGLLYELIMPPFLFAFFGVFVGTVQAFVFTMLSLTYISNSAAEAHDE